jgi:hypothetical protein
VKYCNNITQEYLKSILSYDQGTGVFTWLLKTSNRVKVGMQAGTLRNNGYLKINLNGQLYYVHRLAWLYVTGEWPKNNIDHINGAKDDNRWVNLREATHSQNNRNRASYGKQTLGKSIYKHRGKFTVRVSLGTFDTINEAEETRDKFLK